VTDAPLQSNWLLEVWWDEKAVMMYAEDIRQRGERVLPKSA
jgi:hypothetical protein